jgi:hypothetical protein
LVESEKALITDGFFTQQSARRLLLPSGALQQRYFLLIETSGPGFDADGVRFEQRREEHAGGQIRACDGRMASVTVVEHGFVELGQKTLPDEADGNYDCA